jgi:hypothetical protein
MDLELPLVERDETIRGLLSTNSFQLFLGDRATGLPSEIPTRYPYAALLTTPGTGKSRMLHELCASSPVREAAQRRGVDILPLLITFNCKSDLTAQPTADTIAREIGSRIVLDGYATAALDRRLVDAGLDCSSAIEHWLELRAPQPTRDLIILFGVDEITKIRVRKTKQFHGRERSRSKLLMCVFRAPQDPIILTRALDQVSSLMRLKFKLPGGKYHACILPVLAGVSQLTVGKAASSSNRTVQTVPVPLLSKIAVVEVVLRTLGNEEGRNALRDPVFRWNLMLADGHPRTLRNVLLPFVNPSFTGYFEEIFATVDPALVARIQLRMEVSVDEADVLVSAGVAAQMRSPSRPVRPSSEGSAAAFASTQLRLQIPPVFLGAVRARPLGFLALREAVENLRISPSGENFEVVVAAALASRIRCLGATGRVQASVLDLFGDRAVLGEDSKIACVAHGDAVPRAALSAVTYPLAGYASLELVRVARVDEFVRKYHDQSLVVVYSGYQGINGAIDVAVIFADQSLLMVQCKMSDTAVTLAPSVIEEEQAKAQKVASELRPAQLVPLVIVSQYPCSPSTLAGLKGPVVVVDRRALRHFLPRSYAGLVRGKSGQTVALHMWLT